MDNDLFIVVSWEEYSQSFTSILQLERGGINHEYDPSTQEAPVVQSEFSVTFRLPLPPPPSLPLQWGYALQADTEASLHMVPNWNLNAHEEELQSCIFNLKTKKCKPVPPPHASNHGGQFVSLGAHVYFFPHPFRDTKEPDPILERYDPLKDEWKKLEPIPQDFKNGFPYFMANIQPSAVWDDTILLNLFESQLCAYNVTKKKWYQVKKPRDCDIEGEAFVIGDTIYALSAKDFDSVAVLSIIKKVVNNDDLVYTCNLLKIIKVPGEEDIEFDYAEGCRLSRNLVHLGEGNFCLVHTCKSEYMEEYQPIQLTHIKFDIKRKGKKSTTVTNKSVHQFKLGPSSNEQFQVRHCFSLPKRKTTDLKEGQTSFVFDPFPESFLSRRASKHKDRTNINRKREVLKPALVEENATLPKDSPLFDVQGATSELDAKSNVASKASTISAVIGHPSHAYEKASLALQGSTLGVSAAPERSNTDEEGRSICVVKLSSVASARELLSVLKRYGPIMQVWIHVPTNATSKPCAYVEFENAAAMRLAIEESPMLIGGRRAVIQNVRRNVDVFVACEGDLSDMAEAPAVVAPQPVSFEAFGNAFVQEYYHVLYHSPALVHRFYQGTSVLVRPEDDGSLSVTTSVNAIKEKILSLNYGDCTSIKSIDVQESFRGAVQVFVTGYLTGTDNRIRNFSQCFLLAPQDQGFLVLHDIFRYVESSSQPHDGEQVLVDDMVVKDPVSQEQIQQSYVSDGHVDEVTRGQWVNPPENGDVPVLEEEVKVTEVVHEVQDDCPQASYADIVKRSLFSSPAPVPSKLQEIEGTQSWRYSGAGYSIYIKGLPMNATQAMLEKAFKKFGQIRTDGIRICKQQGACFGFVEFEVQTAVEKALEASRIEVGGCQTVVEEKRSTYSRGNKRGRRDYGAFR